MKFCDSSYQLIQWAFLKFWWVFVKTLRKWRMIFDGAKLKKRGSFIGRRERDLVKPNRRRYGFSWHQSFEPSYASQVRLEINSSSKLPHRLILNARYYPFTTFLKAKLGSNPSFVWRNLFWGKHLIEKRSYWRVGIENGISIYHDRWLPRPSSLRSFSLPLFLKMQKWRVWFKMANGIWGCYMIMENNKSLFQIFVSIKTNKMIVLFVLWR